MSWSEVYKINNNLKRAINEQLRDMKFLPIRIVTQTTSYSPEKTGLYKVICVGAGGNGGYSDSSNTFGGGSGGGGGVAIKTLRLTKGTNYAITVGTTASFAYDSSTILTATSGGSGRYNQGGSGGTASGGDSNYPGTEGTYTREGGRTADATGSVGVFISDLSMTPFPYDGTYRYGMCIAGYGGGGTGQGYYVNSNSYGGYATSGKPAAVLILPLEMEE